MAQSLPDPAALDLKVGFEIHQQLATRSKLFCNCRCKEAERYDRTFFRKLRPTQSELGAYDPAAVFEASKMHTVQYHAAAGTSCLVEADEEPPHEVNPEALETALVFSLALHSSTVDEVHVMRKIVIDGSNTSGFQRTMLVATGGYLEVAGKKVGVQSICLEEDASKAIEGGDNDDDKKMKNYGLDRLGVPLVEIALEPVTAGRPEDMMQVALTLGRLLRASKRVARGLGSIRQDVNVSILGGAVVEVKGVQQLDQLVKVIEHEMVRQHGLVLVAEKLREKGIVNAEGIGDRVEDVTDIMAGSQSNKAKAILGSPGSVFRAIRIRGFAGMLGYQPYQDIRLGKELGELVRFYDLGGVFHSDEQLTRYGFTDEEIGKVRARLALEQGDAFAMVGGPEERVGFAVDAIVRRLRQAAAGVPAETRAATLEGKTVFSRPRPGAARMYPETDIPTIPVTGETLASLAGKVPRPWDEMVDAVSKKYGLNAKLASQIFDSDYMQLFEQIVAASSGKKVQPTFIASKLTEDLTNLQRQGLDASALTDGMVADIFKRLDDGAIAKESVTLIFEKLMKREAATVDAAVRALGASSIGDEELAAAIDRIIAQHMDAVKEKGMGALSMLMGRCMAELRGKADGQKINAVLKEKLQQKLVP
ncbi:Glu-tRNA(Gln) amidotransferase subunit GatE [Nitrososphaera sp.]|uniref:Glu-tRNA(Gln) amidotransferase subunit GatE n=1 Tax=Nitrososphaera sp. TaxID=1971748 RepID=UPI00307E6FE0